MTVGDLVRVQKDQSCGGVARGALGMVVSEDNSQPTPPRWTIHWLYGNDVANTGLRMKLSVTYGYGLEVISSVS